MRKALAQTIEAWQFLSPKMQNDKDIVNAAVTNGLRWRYIPTKYQTKEIAMKVLNSDCGSCNEMPAKWREDLSQSVKSLIFHLACIEDNKKKQRIYIKGY